ncbi:MAG: adenosylcobinamide-GDP ribazoletransferase [Clostridium sp.]|nr:adenosylcobinamide-GDP ribazoletransferase [Clostridium sp.]
MKNLLNAFNMAISMFTVIPLPKYIWEEKSAKYMMRIYPFVGFIVGLIWYGGGVLLKYFDISLMMSTGILLTLPFIVTGFIHLDGFMDVCDALFSRKSKEDKLKILKDSRVGAFAVIALGLLFIMDFAGIYTALEKDFNLIALILIPIISRTIAAYFIISNEPLGESYYGNLFKNGTGKIDKITLGITFITILILSYFLGNKYIIMPLVMGVVGLILLKNCKKELDGINGDVAGYILVLTELFGILVLAVI